MSFSACNFMDEVLNDLAPFIPKRTQDRLSEQDDAVAGWYRAAERAIDKLKNERHKAMQERRELRAVAKRLLAFANDNVPYFGAEPATERMMERAEAVIWRKP